MCRTNVLNMYSILCTCCIFLELEIFNIDINISWNLNRWKDQLHTSLQGKNLVFAYMVYKHIFETRYPRPHCSPAQHFPAKQTENELEHLPTSKIQRHKYAICWHNFNCKGQKYATIIFFTSTSYVIWRNFSSHEL